MPKAFEYSAMNCKIKIAKYVLCKWYQQGHR